MKRAMSAADFGPDTLVIACSSHEPRCFGALRKGAIRGLAGSILFKYDDRNPRREANHQEMVELLGRTGPRPLVVTFTERDAAQSLLANMREIRSLFAQVMPKRVLLDMTVFTKRHLLMVLRWLDDAGLWDRVVIAYTEPVDYVASQFIPLSFGLASFHQVPGLCACPDFSRPVHLVLFLGYEGDRALAVYELVQPVRVTLIVPSPAYNPSWEGRTEAFNADLLSTIGDPAPAKVDSLDPDNTLSALRSIFGDAKERSDEARIVCPLGTKPQTLGVYSFLRECVDPPAVIYAGPLRHNHEFFSHGIGVTWILKEAVAP